MTNKSIVKTEHAPAPIGPYNQAVWAGNFLFISGQIGIDPESGAWINENIESETHRVMQNLNAILIKANLNFANIVKTTIFLADMDDFNRVNQVYGLYFENIDAPARETVEVSYLPKGVNVEISMIAFKN